MSLGVMIFLLICLVSNANALILCCMSGSPKDNHTEIPVGYVLIDVFRCYNPPTCDVVLHKASTYSDIVDGAWRVCLLTCGYHYNVYTRHSSYNDSWSASYKVSDAAQYYFVASTITHDTSSPVYVRSRQHLMIGLPEVYEYKPSLVTAIQEQRTSQDVIEIQGVATGETIYYNTGNSAVLDGGYDPCWNQKDGTTGIVNMQTFNGTISMNNFQIGN